MKGLDYVVCPEKVSRLPSDAAGAMAYRSELHRAERVNANDPLVQNQLPVRETFAPVSVAPQGLPPEPDALRLHRLRVVSAIYQRPARLHLKPEPDFFYVLPRGHSLRE